MIFIDLENNPPPQNWIDRADAITQQLINNPDEAVRVKIIKKNESLWSELKDHLAMISNRKCWYTESINDGAHCHVDHFRPKTRALDVDGNDQGGYWWLAFNWLNYRYSGPTSNVRKRDYFPVERNKANAYADNIVLEEALLLDPVIIGDTTKLAFDVEGNCTPKSSNTSSRDYKRAAYSIERYNLNVEGLKEGRRQKQVAASRLIARSQQLLSLQAVNHDQARESEIMNIWKALRQMANAASEYSSAVKFCLKSSGLDWANDIAIAA